MIPTNNKSIFPDKNQPSTSNNNNNNGNQGFRPSVSVSGIPLSYNSNLVVTQQQQPNVMNNAFQLNTQNNSMSQFEAAKRIANAMQQQQHQQQQQPLHLINRANQSPMHAAPSPSPQIVIDRPQMVRLPGNSQTDNSSMNNIYQALYLIQQNLLHNDKNKQSGPAASTIYNQPQISNNTVSQSFSAAPTTKNTTQINNNNNQSNATVLSMSNANIQLLEAIGLFNSQQGAKQASHSNVSLIQSDSAVAQQLLSALQSQSPRTSTGMGSQGFMLIGPTSKPSQTQVINSKETSNAVPLTSSSHSNGNDMGNSLFLKMPINSKADIPVWTKLLDNLSNNPENLPEVNRNYKIRDMDDNQRNVNTKILSQPQLLSDTTKIYSKDYIQRGNDLLINANNIKSTSISSKPSNNIDTHQILRDAKIISYMMPSSNNVSINNEDMVNQHFRESLRDKLDAKKSHTQSNAFHYKSFDSSNTSNNHKPGLDNNVLNITPIRKKSHCSFIDLERPEYANKNVDGISRVSTPNQDISCISGTTNTQLSIKETADAMVENLIKRSLTKNHSGNTHNPSPYGTSNMMARPQKTNEVSPKEIGNNRLCQPLINTHSENVMSNSRGSIISNSSMFQDSNNKVGKFTNIRPNPSKSDLPLKKRIMLDFNENCDENIPTIYTDITYETKSEINVPSENTEKKSTITRHKRTHIDSVINDEKTDSSYDPNVLTTKRRRGRIPGTGKKQKWKEECRLKEIAKITLAGTEETWPDLVKTIIKPPDIESISVKTLTAIDLEPLKLSKEHFFQIGSCTEIAPRMVKCRSCRQSSTYTNSNNVESSMNAMDDVSSTKSGSKDSSTVNIVSSFCRFHGFRKLQFSAKGTLVQAGFCRSNEADSQDLSLWRMYQPLPSVLSVSISKYIVESLSSIFCEIIDAENKFLQESYESTDDSDNRSKGPQLNSVNKSDLNGFVWKRPVQGVREMCDVCETSIFNTHWACRKCGYSICVDCFNERYDGQIPNGTCSTSSPQQDFGEKDKDSSHNKTFNALKNAVHQNTRGANKNRYFSCGHPWAVCTANRHQHNPDQMLKVELIPVRVINELRNRMHTVARLLNIRLKCNCSAKSKLGNKLLRQISLETIPNIDSDNTSSANFDLHMLADIALKEVLHTDDKESRPVEHTDKPCVTGAPRPPPVLSPPHHPENNNYTSGNNQDFKQSEPEVSFYSWIKVSSNFKMIHLHDAQNTKNLKLFQQEWLKAHPILVSGCHNTMDLSLWTPEKFLEEFESESALLVDCETGFPVPRATMKSFWEGFACVSKRISSSEGSSKPACLKLKDWPPSDDLNDVLPQRCKDIMSNLPIQEYTGRQGEFNLAAHLPDFFVRPDLGPKLYNAYGMPRECKLGTTNLHLDIADAVNVMLYVGVPSDQTEIEVQNCLDSMKEAMVDECVIKRADSDLPGALWHIFLPKDVPKLRQFLVEILLERGEIIGPNQDPIHDQQFYLNQSLLDRLKEEKNVEGCAIVQFRGDAVFIPAGSPHQVRNLHSCMKVANDFVSPENILNCLLVTKEFRKLSATHANHEDKLQAKNMIFHTIKDAVSTLIVKNSLLRSEVNVKQEEYQEKKNENNLSVDGELVPWSMASVKIKDEL